MRIGCLLLVLPVLSPALCQEMPLTHYRAGAGAAPLPSAHVMKSHQDRLGYIWALNFSSGLLRYDGVAFERYGVEDGLPDLYVYEIVEDAEGRLWVGCGGGLAVSAKSLDAYGPGERIRFRTEWDGRKLTQTTIKNHCLEAAADGSVWVASQADGVLRYRIEGDSMEVDVFPLPAETIARDVSVYCVASRENGEIWISVSGDTAVLRPGAKAFELQDLGLDSGAVTAIFEDEANRLWVGCDHGEVYRVEYGEDSAPRLRGGSTILAERVSGFVKTPNGRILAYSYGSGAVELDPESMAQWLRYSSVEGLLSDNVHHVLRDREDNLWFSQTLGLSKLRANHKAHLHFTDRVKPDGSATLTTPGVQGVAPHDAASPLPWIWAATEGGGVAAISWDGRSEIFTINEGLKSNIVYTILRDRRGRVWSGSATGIRVFSRDSPEALFPGEEPRRLSIFETPVFSAGFATHEINHAVSLMLPSGDGRLEEVLCFLSKGGVYLLFRNRWLYAGHLAGLPEGDLFAVAACPDGRVWIGSQDHGLFGSVEPLSIDTLVAIADDRGGRGEMTLPAYVREAARPMFRQVWSGAQGAPNNHVRSLVWRSDALWVGGPTGLALVSDDAYELVDWFDKRHGFGADNMTSIAVSPVDGSFWVGTNGGLTQFDPERRAVIGGADKNGGLLDDEVWYFSSVAVGKDGFVYFGTPKGISIYKPDLDISVAAEPNLRLDDVDWRQNAWAQNHFRAQLRSLNFANEERIRWRARLRGYDDWSAIGRDGLVEYDNLPAFLTGKRYRLEAQASLDGQGWQAPLLTYEFVAAPPFWLRWWFLGSVILAMAAGGYGYSRWRGLLLERANQALERKVAARTAELESKNLELEAKNREIVRTQRQLAVREKMASIGALTSGVAHELRNPMNFVNNMSAICVELTRELHEIVASSGADKERPETLDLVEDLAANAKVIQRHGKRAEHIVGRMMELSSDTPRFPVEVGVNLLICEYARIAHSAFCEREKGVEVALIEDCSADPDVVEVNPQSLGRAIICLVNNSLDAVAERASSAPQGYRPEVSVSAAVRDHRVILRVADNGPGVDPDCLDQMFSPFFTTKPAGSGHIGLGLAIAYEIVVKECGGEINALPQEDGAVFEIALPLAVEEQTAAAAKALSA